ncbi:hypothetical protein FH039_04805 [Thermococcus indicus]|uniref:Tetratricopeptide repeat protein n=1 Tax=Thermococcus indicus TaxID=2586643 RepID=A0A4Y5SJK0_9EURY|nr:hypothetical protein [Thermococcus indicus]QDA31058.1 hypothetical protein FH039_04805 [Thermococcus indicus]
MSVSKLDEFFGSLGGKENKKSDLEILDEIEDSLKEGNIDQAILLLRDINKEHNLFLALRMVLREILSKDNLSGNASEAEVRSKIKELTLLVNTILNPLHRAVLMADIAIAFYRINDDFSGDLTLKAAIDLAINSTNILKEIILGLVNHGLLDKAGYAMNLVKDPEKLDVVLVQLAEKLYREGDLEKATRVLKHITHPFHKAMALYSIALIEADRNREDAKKILEVAFKVAEKIDDPHARFEVNMKLYDLKHRLEGTSVSLMSVLSGEGKPPE